MGEPVVLLALAAVVLGVVWLALLLVPRPPGEDSAEAGFTRDMMSHHAQAVQMAEAVRDRTEDPAIRVLATDIVLTQQAEIGQMRGWLEAWGLSGSQTGPAMEWMGHPTTGPMPGMAAPEDLALLRRAPPEEADEQFLRLMIPHHQAAVVMAEAVLERGDQPEVTRFAERTALNQQGEVRGMQALLERKGLAPVEGEPDFGEHASHSGEHASHANLAGVLWDTARLAPLPLAVLAAAWLGLDALRRRRTGLAGPVVLSSIWEAAAVGGLVVSAALHAGLAPAHFAQATVHGVFFFAAGVALAIVAAAVLAWPSSPAYLAGVGVSLALVVLWAVFQIVPGAGMAEGLDPAGLLAKVAELLAATACVALWFRARRRVRRTKRGSVDEPVAASR